MGEQGLNIYLIVLSDDKLTFLLSQTTAQQPIEDIVSSYSLKEKISGIVATRQRGPNNDQYIVLDTDYPPNNNIHLNPNFDVYRLIGRVDGYKGKDPRAILLVTNSTTLKTIEDKFKPPQYKINRLPNNI